MSFPGDRTSDPPMRTATATDESLKMTIVRAVAAVEAEDPQSLSPLGDVVDLDALADVASAADGETQVAFSYAGHRVVVSGSTVEIY